MSALGLDDVVEWRLEDQRAHRPALGAAAHLQVCIYSVQEKITQYLVQKRKMPSDKSKENQRKSKRTGLLCQVIQ